MSTQRLQKILAQSGIASRRAAEQLIVDGRVRVNGRIVRELGSRANLLHDRVEVNGKRLVAEKPIYYLFHKPRGVVTTLDDPEGRKTVKDFMRDVRERVFPVGRLDFHTSGVLLLTNDGALAQALLHPKRAVPKTYNAKLQGQVEQTKLDALRAGVVLDDGDRTAPAEVCLVRSDGKHTALEITIAEGKNRQIHRMGEAIGHPVLRLTRVSFAGLTLERLQVGQKRQLTAKELGELKQQYLHSGVRTRAHKSRFERAQDFDDVIPAHPTQPRDATGPNRMRAGARDARGQRGAHTQRARSGRRETTGGRVRVDDRSLASRGERRHRDPTTNAGAPTPRQRRVEKRDDARVHRAQQPRKGVKRTR